MNIFQINTKIFKDIAFDKVLKNLDLKKVVIITDNTMIKIGLVEKIEMFLKENSVNYTIFSEVEVDPSFYSIKKSLDTIIKFVPETIIALGGGSTLDTAKASSYFLSNIKKEISIIAIPTTCGTGSEVTSYSVITDVENQKKIALKDDLMIPKIAILDSQFTKTLPKVVVADGGIDALTHAIEAYTNKDANIHTQLYAMEAIKLIFKNLLNMYKNIENKTYRENMALASSLAGIAFEKSGLGINHSLAHSIGGRYHKSHGRVNGMILPYIIRFNKSNNTVLKRYFKIARELGFPSSTYEEGAESLALAVEILNQNLNIPRNIKQLNINIDSYKESIDNMGKSSLEDICTQGNIKKVNLEDMINLLKSFL